MKELTVLVNELRKSRDKAEQDIALLRQRVFDLEKDNEALRKKLGDVANTARAASVWTTRY